MPVQVTCSCGKQMKVPEQYAGKRVKCPKCGAPNNVPAETVAGKRDASANTIHDPPPPGMVRFRCACGKQMQAKAEYAGRMTRCPSCQATLPIPQQTESPPAAEASQDATMHESSQLASNADFEAPAEKKQSPAKPARVSLVARLRKLVVPVIVLAALSSLAIAGWWLFTGGTPADLALVPTDAQAFVSLRLADAWQNPAVQAALKDGKGQADLTADLEKSFGMPASDIERVSFVVKNAGKNESCLIVAAKKPFDRAKVLARLEGGVKSGKQAPKAYQVAAKPGPGADHQAVWFAGERIIVLASEPAMKVFAVAPTESKPTGPLADALHRASGSVLAVAYGPAPTGKAAGEVAGGSSSPAWSLLEALTNRLTADLATAPLVRKKMLARVDAVVAEIAATTDPSPTVTDFEAKAIVEGVVQPAVAALKSAASTATGLSNLQQIGEAFLAYHNAKGRFPPAAVVKNGKPLYSWRVELLPYLEEKALYEQFKKDEPFDSPANKALWSKMPKVFALPGKPGDSDKTYYQLFVGPKAIFSEIGKVPKLADLSSAPSKTLLAVESAKPVIWCEPVDLPFVAGPNGVDPKLLGGHFGEVFHAIMADGSPIAVKRSIKPQTLQTAILAGARPPLGDDWESAIGP